MPTPSPTRPVLPDCLAISGIEYRAVYTNWQILHQSPLNHVRLWQVVANCYPNDHHAKHSRRQAWFKLPLVIKTIMPTADARNRAQFDHEIAMLRACQSLAVPVLGERLPCNKNRANHSSQSAIRQAGVAQLLFDDTAPHAAHERMFAMPYYPAPNLRQLLDQQTLNFAQTRSVAQQLCQVVTALHALGALHGDLKPSNILYSPNHQRLVVLDFALAQVLSGASDQTLPPTTTAGTPAYMAPERFFGAPPNAAQEAYSVGVILFELFTNTRPFAAASIREWANVHQNAPLPDIMPRIDARFADDITFNHRRIDQVEQIIHDLMAKRPDNRQNLLAIAQILA